MGLVGALLAKDGFLYLKELLGIGLALSADEQLARAILRAGSARSMTHRTGSKGVGHDHESCFLRRPGPHLGSAGVQGKARKRATSSSSAEHDRRSPPARGQNLGVR